jgi:peptidoglycan/xylan/chitin deacetylase (PgdA/CDA1 family)
MTRKKFVTKPQSVVSTSWDDGAPLDCELSRLLNKHKVQATFYVPWKPDNYDRIDDNELKKLARHFEIGAHTLTHPDLTAVPLREAKREILGGKNELSALLNQEVEVFCYPRGKYTREIVSLVKESGFIGARTIECFRVLRPVDFYRLWATVPANPYSFWKAIGSIARSSFFANLAGISMVVKNVRKSWIDLATAYFDYVRKNGGIFHLFGHSWEIERFGLWDELDEVLAYIAAHDNVMYLTNGELIRTLKAN